MLIYSVITDVDGRELRSKVVQKSYKTQSNSGMQQIMTTFIVCLLQLAKNITRFGKTFCKSHFLLFEETAKKV